MSRDNLVALGVLLCYAVMIAVARWAVVGADRRRPRRGLRVVTTAARRPPARTERGRPRNGDRP